MCGMSVGTCSLVRSTSPARENLHLVRSLYISLPPAMLPKRYNFNLPPPNCKQIHIARTTSMLLASTHHRFHSFAQTRSPQRPADNNRSFLPARATACIYILPSHRHTQQVTRTRTKFLQRSKPRIIMNIESTQNSTEKIHTTGQDAPAPYSINQ